MDSSIIQCLRKTFLQIIVDEPVVYSEPDQDDPSRVALLLEQESNYNALSSAPPPPKRLLFFQLPGQVRDLKWWLTKYPADHVDILHMYAEMGNVERTEMQLKSQDS